MLDGGSATTAIDKHLTKQQGLGFTLRQRKVWFYNGKQTSVAGYVDFKARAKNSVEEWHEMKAVTKTQLYLPRMRVSWRDWVIDKPEFAHILVEDVSYQDS
jgi:hypothetical protein